MLYEQDPPVDTEYDSPYHQSKVDLALEAHLRGTSVEQEFARRIEELGGRVVSDPGLPRSIGRSVLGLRRLLNRPAYDES